MWSKVKLIAYGWTACAGSAVLVSWVYAGDEWSVPALELLAWLALLGLAGFWGCVWWFANENGLAEWLLRQWARLRGRLSWRMK